MTEDTTELAAAVGVDTTVSTWLVRRADLAEFLSRAGVPLDDLDAVIAVTAAAQGDVLPYELRVGEWQVSLAPAAAKALINGTVLTTVLGVLHETSIPATVLSVVVPLLFDLQRVALSPSDRYLYAVLLNAPHPGTSVEDWYDRLPTRVTDEITEIEFRDIIGRLGDAGLAGIEPNGVVTATPTSARRLVKLKLPAPPAQSDYR